MVIVADSAISGELTAYLNEIGENAYLIGEIEKARDKYIYAEYRCNGIRRGTNLQAILDRIEDGTLSDCRVVTVVSSRKGAYALERAKTRN